MGFLKSKTSLTTPESRLFQNLIFMMIKILLISILFLLLISLWPLINESFEQGG